MNDNRQIKEKLEKIDKVSNIKKVLKNMKKYKIESNLFISPRKNAKFYVIDPSTNKKIHFGNINYQDYTFTGDKEKLRKFKIRNHKWETAPKYTSRYLSYFLLWS